LDVLAAVDAGREPPGLEAASARMRVLRQHPGGDLSFAEAVERFARVGGTAEAAE
jgi:hypothetical protein